MSIPFDADRIRQARVAQAEHYVTTRFFPALPVEYGALAVLALDLIHDGDATPIDVDGLPVRPKSAYLDDLGQYVIDPRDLVAALRLEHMIDG